MYNDFKGDTKDFAMVVPVPVVLRKDDIKVVEQGIFQRLNDYSAPRLVGVLGPESLLCLRTESKSRYDAFR